MLVKKEEKKYIHMHIAFRQPCGIFSGFLMLDPFTETRFDTLVIELPLGNQRKKQKETLDWTCARAKFG